MKQLLVIIFILTTFLSSCDQKKEKFNGLNLSLGNLYRLSDARSRSISPENFTGEKGKGGMATLENGVAAGPARELGQGWKVNPYVIIPPGEDFTLAEITGEGAIQHIWMTPACNYRLSILRFYWDDEEYPSVEVPVGDFFASGWGQGFEPEIRSLAVCVNPKSGFNCYWQMPFRKKCKITMENMDTVRAVLFYQIDYTLTNIPEDAAYFHAQFNRIHPLPEKEVYTIVDNIKGKGQYVGTYIAHGAYSDVWWGEGEVKFYIDGDKDFPTICGTGEEDYFCGSYDYKEYRDENGVVQYHNFSSPYTGFYYFKDNPEISYETKVNEYRWHIADPVRFEKDLKVTIQSLGWKPEGIYKPLQDDLASVAYWYQTEPHNPFPELPSKEKLVIKKENKNPNN